MTPSLAYQNAAPCLSLALRDSTAPAAPPPFVRNSSAFGTLRVMRTRLPAHVLDLDHTQLLPRRTLVTIHDSATDRFYLLKETYRHGLWLLLPCCLIRWNVHCTPIGYPTMFMSKRKSLARCWTTTQPLAAHLLPTTPKDERGKSGACAARNAGASDSTIMFMGKWKSLSTFLDYQAAARGTMRTVSQLQQPPGFQTGFTSKDVRDLNTHPEGYNSQYGGPRKVPSASRRSTSRPA